MIDCTEDLILQWQAVPLVVDVFDGTQTDVVILNLIECILEHRETIEGDVDLNFFQGDVADHRLYLSFGQVKFTLAI